MSVILSNTPPPSAFPVRPVRVGTDIACDLGGPTQRINRMGDKFQISVTLPPMDRILGEAWVADLLQSFNSDVTYPYPIVMGGEAASGSPRVNGSGQAGLILNLKGFGSFYHIRKGRFFSILNAGVRYLHQVGAAADVDDSGLVTLSIWPMLRVEPDDSAIIEFDQPYVQGLLSGDQGNWDLLVANYLGLAFTITENT